MSTRVYVAGHAGLVGSALVRALRARSDTDIITRDRRDLDLENQHDVFAFFERERPEQVYLAAARVGGIMANQTYGGDFIRSNLSIQCNVIEAARRYGVRKLLFLGSVCVYPKFAKMPIAESELLSGYLEPTNQPYAIAKIAGIEMCRAYNRQYGTNFISVMPTNLYGPGDNFDPEQSHVIPGFIRRFDEARRANAASISLWGTGEPRREFLHVDDLADACLLLMERHDGNEIINIGSGEDLTIRELATRVSEIVGFRGAIEWDHTKPDGTPRRLLDTTRLTAYGWRPRIDFNEGLRTTYAWYVEHGDAVRE